MTYRQLTLDERYQIAALLKQQCSFAEIGRTLKRHATTIAREVKRNVGTWGMWENGYFPTVAADLTATRRKNCRADTRKIHGPLQDLVERKLRMGWSPEQICGRLLVELDIKLTHETVYQHVLRDAAADGDLRFSLRRHRSYRKKHKAHVDWSAKAKRVGRHLENRPAAANDRTELGHWERDCIVGPGKAALLTMVERKSRFTRIARVKEHNATAVGKATAKLLDGLPARSITNDNGAEFRRSESLEARLGIPIFFCDPASPWQRGSIENTNGLAREYMPKKTCFDAVPQSAIVALEETLNHRPRKTLGFRTPYEALFDEKTALLQQPHRVHFGLEYGMTSLFSPI